MKRRLEFKSREHRERFIRAEMPGFEDMIRVLRQAGVPLESCQIVSDKPDIDEVLKKYESL